jgi:hypothetical protein
MPQPFEPDTRFIHMIDTASQHQLLEDSHAWRAKTSGLLKPDGKRSLREVTPEEILTPFPETLHGQQWKRRERDRHGLHPWSIVRGCGHSRRKGRRRDLLTGGAADGFHPVFHDSQPPFWHVLDVSACFDLPGDPCQLALTPLTLAGSMNDDLIRLLHLLQRVPSVSWLSSRRTAVLRLGLPSMFGAVTRRGLAPIMAILRQPPFPLVIAQQGPHQERFPFLNPPIFPTSSLRAAHSPWRSVNACFNWSSSSVML